MQSNEIDPAKLQDVLAYCPKTGKLTWKPRGHPQWDGQNANSEALASVFRGYKRGKVFGVNHRAHRVAWALYYGEWPKGQIDHINGNRSDNRIENLREVTNQENAKNKRHIPCASGYTGIKVCHRSKRWRAVIKVDGKHLSLGHFDNLSDAIKARKDAERRFGFHPNHGRK